MTISDLMAKAEYAQELLAEVVGSKNRTLEGVSLCGVERKYIHVYEGIEILAREAGETLYYQPRNSTEYNAEYFFTHNGKRYIQLEDSKEKQIDAAEWSEGNGNG